MESKTNQPTTRQPTKQKKPNSWKKRSDLWLPEVGVGGLDKGGQEASTCGFKIGTKGVTCSVVTTVNSVA